MPMAAGPALPTAMGPMMQAVPAVLTFWIRIRSFLGSEGNLLRAMPLSTLFAVTWRSFKEGKKSKFSLGVAEPKLGSHISGTTKITCQSGEFVLELLRGVRLHFDNFIRDLKHGELEKVQLGLAYNYSKTKVEWHAILKTNVPMHIN
ncbi:hypothetical protein F3Y22_tig00110332pilonHSYRG00182 [Hibiscus syriacus]|uniref:Uncharacterized protein n=1 Tax=Hibiscus syriacus TaxID=106335 RepID=A0A6A3AY28_HIBSY|nr:hypothetical protein F3Y22_tig00110332pilonHSYRG00182 [Hibiscus syriacus]